MGHYMHVFTIKRVVRETDKAWLVEFEVLDHTDYDTQRDVWVPKSRAELCEQGGETVLRTDAWLAKRIEEELYG